MLNLKYEICKLQMPNSEHQTLAPKTTISQII